jgi:lysophospholipase L1-like esterase
MQRGQAVGRWCAAGAVSLALAWAGACGGSPTQPTPPTPTPDLTLTCPATITADSTNGQAVAVTYTTPTAQGGAPPAPVSCSPGSGGLFPVGNTAVSCTASDRVGQTAGCNFTVTVRPPPVLSLTKFLAFGDSLTSGVTSPALPYSTIVVALPDSYPSKLTPRLASRYPSQTITVDNVGWPGETATDAGQYRLRSELAVYRPEVLLLMEGANDLLTHSPEQVVLVLEGMVRDAMSTGALTMIATIPPQRAGGLRNRDRVAAMIPGFNDQIRAMASRQGITVVDVYAELAKDMSLIGQDDLHPTVQGYEVMARVFYDAIVARLEARAAAALR